jgi:hypothetical protein
MTSIYIVSSMGKIPRSKINIAIKRNNVYNINVALFIFYMEVTA